MPARGPRPVSNDLARRPTIRQVAALAGVSHQTVSRYLRDDPAMRPQIRERVAAAVSELGYRPNLTARAMRTRRSGRLALVLPLGTATGSLGILEGARRAATEAGYDLEMLFLDDGASSREERILEFVDAGFFEGIVSLVPLPEPLVGSSSATPIVVTNDYDTKMHSIGRLAGAEAVWEIVERLVQVGHRHFLHMAGGYEHTSGRNRRDAYLAAVAGHGGIDHGVIDCAWEDEPARRAILDLPDDSPVTAVITANDQLAAGVVRGATERGWRIPEDLVVTGWDDHVVGSIMPPSLTTVRTHHELIGRAAIERLAAALRGEPDVAATGTVTEVVWRESTGDLTPGSHRPPPRTR